VADPAPPSGDIEAFEVSAPIACVDPHPAGIARLREEGQARGLHRPLSDPFSALRPTAWGQGGHVVATDFDGDGDIDLLFGRVDAAPDLYENDGRGVFELQPPMPLDVTRTPELSRILAVAAGDLDGDGLPEILLGGDRAIAVSQNEGGLRFSAPSLIWTDPLDDALAYVTFLLGDADGDGALDLALPSVGHAGENPTDGGADNAAPDRILLQRGTTWIEGPLLFATDRGSVALVGLWTDRDRDGDMDLLIPADLNLPTAFWRNDGLDAQGAPIFSDVAEAHSARLTMGAMGIDAADLNGDGQLDFCISNTGPPRCLTSYGDGYMDNAAAMGLRPEVQLGEYGTIGWAVEFADIDSDGELEFLQASGPTSEGSAAPEVLAYPNVLWRGHAGPSFTDETEEAGFDDLGHHPGMASADFDGDGWLDIVVAGPMRVPLLYMNRCGSESWLEVDVVGPPGNREGFGTQVEARVGDRVRVRQLDTSRATGQSPSLVHFGLGETEVVDELTVRWPGGRVAHLGQVPVRTRVTAFWDAAHAVDSTQDSPDPTMVLQGTVSSPPSDTPVEGAEVWTSLAPDARLSTDADGAYSLAVPDGADIDVHARAAGRVESIVAVDGSWQRVAADGLQHMLFAVPDFDGFVENAFSEPIDPGRGHLWVQVFDGGSPAASLPGSHVWIDTESAGSVVVGNGPAQAGNLLGEGSRQVIFGNVLSGPVDIVVTPPGDEVCAGRSTVIVEPGTLTQVRFRCE
jgi:hypothetical protein